jgi:hypothetical protein
MKVVEAVHEWQKWMELTKKMVSDGWDTQVMEEYITMLPKPRQRSRPGRY